MKQPRMSARVTWGVLILHTVLAVWLLPAPASGQASEDNLPLEVREQLRRAGQLEILRQAQPREARRPRPTGVALLDEPGEVRDDARFEEIAQVHKRHLTAALDSLLAPQPAPAPPGPWVFEPVPDVSGWTQAQIDSLVQVYVERDEVLRMWWLEQIVNSPMSLTEAMVHFWHDHFATGMETVFFPQSMYRQNATLREHALGNFKTLTYEIAIDPAMLLWLDGQTNKVTNPNENFARELLELFTMGEGSGYSQTDIEEAARACTGWVTPDGVQSVFYPYRHDYGSKTFLGQTGNWDMQDIVDIVFEQDATAEYLCGKLYRWFLDDEPAPEDVQALAQILRDNDYEVEPVLRTLLGSTQFFDPQYRGSIIKDGLDLYGGITRSFHMSGFNPSADPMGDQGEFVFLQMYFYGHLLLDPPNVAGWPGHRNWINTFTLPIRKFLSSEHIDGMFGNANLGYAIDVMTETARFTDPEDADALVDDLALLCFGQPPTPLVRQAMLDELLAGEAPSYWTMSLPDAQLRLETLYKFAMHLPDFQLK